MKRIVISDPTKIILNGYGFLFEPGDKISVRSRSEVIKEGLEKLGKYAGAIKKAYKIHSDIEVKIRVTEGKANKAKNPAKFNTILKKLIRQKRQIKKTIDKLEIEMTINGKELEKYGYNKEKRAEFIRQYVEGKRKAAEEEEKAKRGGEIATSRDKIAEKTAELEQAKADQEEFATKSGYVIDGGQWKSPAAGGTYDVLDQDQSSEMEEKFGHIGDLEGEIEELERLGMAQEIERDEEGTDGELDIGIPELTHRVVTQDELDTLPTTDDPYDDPGGVALGDRISQWLIDGGFQPEELGTYSDMIQDIEAA